MKSGLPAIVTASAALLAACVGPPASVVELPRDRVVLLPNSEGISGAIVVRQGEGEATLDKPYASARAATSGGALQVEAADPAAVKRDFAAVFKALPPGAASFVVYFIFSQDELTEESRKLIGPVLEDMARRPAPEITVIGHTDQVGSDSVNDALSLRRAERVKEMLVQRGVSAERITSAGRGSREPLVRTPEGVPESRNRRVEISVR